MTQSARTASTREIDSPSTATRIEKTAVTLNDARYSSLRNRSSKFSNQTYCVLAPKASCTKTDWYSACDAGRKKKISVIAICGAISAYGSQRDSKRARFSIG